jgi:hypothetical protein
MALTTFYYSDRAPSTSAGTIITNTSRAFGTTATLIKVDIGDTVTRVESQAFLECFNLTDITISNSVTSIGSGAFSNCGIRNIVIPNNVTSIESFAFESCFNLTSVTIFNSAINLARDAFESSSNLIRVNFLGNVPTNVHADAFLNGSENLKFYRNKNFVTGWTSTLNGIPVVLISDNVVKSGGSGKLTTKRRPPYDPDATIYINNVEAADGQPLEDTTKNAINAFVVGCKSDGIWDAIKSSCILAGARTLNGALIPLKGTAPTNNFFISSDYNRATGLQGNASNKYLNSNRACDADPVNSIHRAFYITSTSINNNTSIYGAIDACAPADGESLVWISSQWSARIRNTFGFSQGSFSTNGFFGLSSDNSSIFTFRKDSAERFLFRGGLSPKNNNMYIYALNYRDNCARGFSVVSYSNARLTFYSLGENLDLSLLNARINTLMSTISALT